MISMWVGALAPTLEFIHFSGDRGGAGGAVGEIAWGGAPQRGAQPQEYDPHDLISPRRGVRLKKRRHFRKNISNCSMKMELNLMRSTYGKESAAPCRACLTGILRPRGCAPRCGASPRAIVPLAPPAPKINV